MPGMLTLAEEAVGDESVFLHKIAFFDLAHKYGDLMSLDELLQALGSIPGTTPEAIKA